jgi:hypothetical protein
VAQTVLDFERLLRTLVEHRVEFVVVGGVSAALQGAPILTLDLDIVHRRDPGNIERLLKALRSMEASYRDAGTRHILPDHTHLESAGHQLLMTTGGPLDVLGTIGSGRSYDDLLPLSRKIAVGDFKIRVLSLEALIEVKEEIGHAKDRAVLEVLRETLRAEQCGENDV